MDIHAAAALIAATVVLVAIPGPNIALFVAHTLTHGLRHGLVTVVGTSLGVALQLAAVVLGFAVLLEYAASALSWLRWAGVIYLLYLGYTSWRHGPEDIGELAARRAALPRLFWQGLLLALVNPKTLLFVAAFLPQFVSADAATPFALLWPAAIYLGAIFLGDVCWALSASFARPALMRLGRLRHRLTGCLYIGSGIALALARIER